MAKRTSSVGWVRKDDRLFTLEVFVTGGPMTAKFVRKNKVICRTIKIRGDQTLEDLHYVIFTAFGRKEQHMYEFQIGGKWPMDPKARKYVLPGAFNLPRRRTAKPAGDVTRMRIGMLGLKKDDAFGYWFDFGDAWRHQINVVSIEKISGRGKYPKIHSALAKVRRSTRTRTKLMIKENGKP